MRDVLRMLDANLNRAREGLRVVEDWARFVREDERLASDLRTVRRDLSRLHTLEHITARDADHDLGMGTPQRSSATTREMVVANSRRVSEALRAIEEALKVTGGPSAKAERLRHRFYTLEQRAVALAGRPRFADVRVYVLITESVCKRPWREVAEAAIAAGAECVQLREPTLPTRELVERARWLAERCATADVAFVVNDRADVAKAVADAGVHVGQSDLSASDARNIVGVDRLVGVSTHNVEQVRAAVDAGADYVGVGPVFPSATKPREFLPGLAFARQAAAHPLPTVAIGGITIENAAEVFATGVSAVAVTAAVCAADDPGAACAELVRVAATVDAEG
ncbi:MAG: thiamine phosphate synthase [Planctomycetota bacterium]